MRGMEIWISSRLEGSLAKSLSASDLSSMRIVIHSRSAVAMTNDRRLWTLGGSRFFGLSGPEADSCDLKIMSQHRGRVASGGLSSVLEMALPSPAGRWPKAR